MPIYNNLREHQKPAVDFALAKEKSAIFGCPRSGKTWIAGAVLESVQHEDFKCLIVSLKANKETTWKTFLSEQLPQIPTYYFGDTPITKSKFKSGCIILHWEELDKKNLITNLRNIEWDVVVIDESHKGKGGRASVASRRLRQLGAASARYKMLLTGTPIEKDLLQIYTQYSFLYPSLLGTLSEFRYEYCRPCGYMGKSWELRPEKVEALLDKIAPYYYAIDEETANILPANIIPSMVDMPQHTRKIYNDLRSTSVCEFDGVTIVADLKVTVAVKLQQLTSGFIRENTVEGNVDHFVDNVKERRALQLVAKHITDLPIVIFCRYSYEVDRLTDKLARTYPELTVRKFDGKTKGRDKLLTDFQEGDIDIMVCQSKTGGTGVDLYKSNLGIILSSTYSSIDNDQLTCRLNDSNKTVAPTMYRIITKNSIDEQIIETLNIKNTQTNLLRNNK
jgi:SNF2 family DNA or RNA helicase